MAAVTICTDFGTEENKIYQCFYFFPISWPWSDGTGCHDLSFLNVELKPAFSLPSFTLIKRVFSSSLLSVIGVVSYAYLRLLIFLPAILIPAWDSSSLAFCIMYSAYKLNKQGDCSFKILFYRTSQRTVMYRVLALPVTKWTKLEQLK